MTITLENQIVLITGAASGIGKAVALEIAKRGATTLIVARDQAGGEEALRDIQAQSGSTKVELFVADLSSQASIRKLANEFQAEYPKLTVLINCAGIFTAERKVTADGLELMFATNYLGPFLLTKLLGNSLIAGQPARIINVTAPVTTKPNFDDLQGEKNFSAINAFGASKAAELLFTFAIARKLESNGVTANAYHPGVVRTHLMQKASLLMRLVTRLINLVVGISPEQAAEGLAELALSPQFASTTGQLIHKGKPMKVPFQGDIPLQDRLWEVSEQLVKEQD